MIKRAFKLKRAITFPPISINILENMKLNDDVYIVIDEETEALQILYHGGGEKEYIILVPGDPAFVVLKLSKNGKKNLLDAISKLVQYFKLDKTLIEEIEAISEIYLLLDELTKKSMKNKAKEILDNISPLIREIKDRDVLEEIISALKIAIPRIAARKIINDIEIPERVMKYFSREELIRIFMEELPTKEIESYIWRFIKKLIE